MQFTEYRTSSKGPAQYPDDQFQGTQDLSQDDHCLTANCKAQVGDLNYTANDFSSVSDTSISLYAVNRRLNKVEFYASCQMIYSQFGLAIHQNDHQARRRFVEWAQNEIAVVPDFHKRILFSDEAHFWLNGYVNKQNCRIWSEANPQVYVETTLHPEKLTVWCALWAGGILLQKR
ncbi:uncharacterized protein TNCV_2311141 [Trichonephila clavipes]|nr:uncharacterized protein TNCV_2311141 [Trichonephila clavipes]